MKMIEWIKSLFKKKETLVEVKEPVAVKMQEEVKLEPEVKPVVKKKRRGRPRKKKVEQK